MDQRLPDHDAPYPAGDDLRRAAGMHPPPMWAVKAAILAALVVLAIPLAILGLAALLAGAVVFLLLLAAATVYRRLRGLRRLLGGRRGGRVSRDGRFSRGGRRGDGRRNVRVIDREDPHS
jgi:hypothetical protein